jgi:S-adenosylmethionine hydrolase
MSRIHRRIAEKLAGEKDSIGHSVIVIEYALEPIRKLWADKDFHARSVFSPEYANVQQLHSYDRLSHYGAETIEVFGPEEKAVSRKIVRGKFIDVDRPQYTQVYANLVTRVQGGEL